MVINKVISSWYDRFPGCTTAQHHADLTAHEAQNPEAESHFSLQGMFPQRLPFNALDFKGFMSREDIEDAGGIPHADTLKSIYCGVTPDGDDETPRTICLHKQAAFASDEPVVDTFDIDSYCGITDTLAVARGGLALQTVSNERTNIKAKVHGHIQMLHDDAEDPLELRDIPHQFIGRIANDAKIALYFFYPSCPLGDRGKFTCLTNQQLTHWNNEIWLQALYDVLPAAALQDLPSSYRNASHKALTRQTEARLREGGAYASIQQISNPIQAHHLRQITIRLREIVQQPAHRDFHNFQIYFCAKGVKNEFRTTATHPRLQDAMTDFLNHMKDRLDRRYIPWNRFWIDIGKESCVSYSYLRSKPPTADEPQPQVLIPRRCCLEKYHDWYYADDEKTYASSTQLYSMAMLGEAATLTTTPPLSSRMRAGGLIYTQVYARVKTMLEASKHFVNQQDGLEELALDPNIAAGIQEGAGGRSRRIPVIEQAYLAGKQRLAAALRDDRYKSYAVRQEHRITFELFLQIWEALDEMDDHRVLDPDTSRPEFVWAIPSKVYTQYLRRHAGKFNTGFELIRATSSDEVKTWEQTKMMTMFLRCLRYATGGHQLGRENALWTERKDYDNGKIYYGLNFRHAIEHSHYCWIRPDLIDWGQLEFEPDMTEDVVFSNKTQISKLLKRGKRLRYFFDETKQIDVAINMIRAHRNTSPAIVNRALQFLAHLAQRQFRADLWAKIKGEVIQQPEVDRTEHQLGNWYLSWESIYQLYGREPHLTHGNRSGVISVLEKVRFIFDVEPDSKGKGKGWNDPWVRFLRRIITLLDEFPDHRILMRFRKLFQQIFFEHHWIIPNPHRDGLLQTTKTRNEQKTRPWVSIMCDFTEAHAEQARGQLPGTDCYYWGGKDYRLGDPPRYPAYLKWDREQWDEWIQTTLAAPPAPPAPPVPPAPAVPSPPPPSPPAPAVRYDRPLVVPPTGRNRSPSATTKILLEMYRQPRP